MSYYVYILANAALTVVYVGVTNDLVRRLFEHVEKVVDGFTKRYKVARLVYYEEYGDPVTAITREKQLKAGSRQRKLDLVTAHNSAWRDLYDEIVGD